MQASTQVNQCTPSDLQSEKRESKDCDHGTEMVDADSIDVKGHSRKKRAIVDSDPNCDTDASGGPPLLLG